MTTPDSGTVYVLTVQGVSSHQVSKIFLLVLSLRTYCHLLTNHQRVGVEQQAGLLAVAVGGQVGRDVDVYTVQLADLCR